MHLRLFVFSLSRRSLAEAIGGVGVRVGMKTWKGVYVLMCYCTLGDQGRGPWLCPIS